jgi:hypothetical protein
MIDSAHAHRLKGEPGFHLFAALEMTSYSAERLPLLSQSPSCSVRRRNVVASALTLALIALSLLAERHLQHATSKAAEAAAVTVVG